MADWVIRPDARESATLDMSIVNRLRSEVGEARWGEQVEDAVYCMTRDLTELDTCFAAIRSEARGVAPERVLEVANRLGPLAGAFGLRILEQVCTDLQRVAETGDRAATAAIAARALRLGEEAVFALVALVEGPTLAD